MNRSFDIDENNLKQIVGPLGHRLDSIVGLLRPKDLAYFASTNKENLSHVQSYLKHIKEKWKGREQYRLEYDVSERHYVEMGAPGYGKKRYHKFFMIFDNVNTFGAEPIAIEVLNIYSGCACKNIKIFGLAIGGKGCTKMQDGKIPKEKREEFPLILRPYPIFVSQQFMFQRSNPRFIPYQI